MIEHAEPVAGAPVKKRNPLLRQWWLAAVVVFTAAVVFWLWSGPYDSATRVLRAGMTAEQAVRAIGLPPDDATAQPVVYKKRGVDQLLLIYFENPGENISAWFILDGPFHPGYDDYRVRKSHEYAPDGKSEGPTDVTTIKATIYTVDIDGKPLPGFER